MQDSSSPKDIQLAAEMRAPSGASAPTKEQRISGSGTTAVGQTTALTVGAFATLVVGEAPVRIGFGSTKALAETDADATALRIAADGRHDWDVTERDQFVACRDATNGAVAFEAWVWTSSGPRSLS